MCGFVGFSGADKAVMEKMLEKIAHRGPDSSGSYIGDEISLGMCRLSIIGLEDGHQPMFNEDGTIVVVYNGEIYNYEVLKEQLIEAGHIFSSGSDTEVLIHGYEEYGESFVTKLRGMFAFALYDIPKKRLLIVRDFFGIKPMYYYNEDGTFLFGSEIKSFLEHPNFKKELNENALANYLTFQYSVLDETFFKGVFKLAPGHMMVYENGEIQISRYFEPDFDPQEMTLEDAVDKIDRSVCESVELHRRVSNVEVGSFLSSGVDSSYVASCFNGDKTFTVGFDYELYNETTFAKELSEKVGVKNFSEIISTDEYWEQLPKVQYHMDEPLADPSAVALYFVSRLAAKHVKVALSGEGADEFFGGYNIYKEPLALKPITILPMPIRRLLGKIASAIPFNIKGKNYLIRGSKTLEERYIGNANMFSMAERERILKGNKGIAPTEITKPYYERYKHHDEITKMQMLDIHLWMVGDILLKADKMSMAHSLEVRVPFLDTDVFNTASKIPTHYRTNKEDTKYAFRKAAKRWLPEQVANKKKLGFPVPIRIWLRDDKYYNIVKDHFTSDTAGKFFKTDELVKLLDNHRNGKTDNSRKIWTVFMFLVWHEEYFG